MLTVQLPPNHAGPTVEVEGPDGRKHTLIVPEHTQGQFQAQVDVIVEMGLLTRAHVLDTAVRSQLFS